jgi:hypothetical protein
MLLRRSRWMAVLAGGLAVVIGLAGCGTPKATFAAAPPATPTPTTTPAATAPTPPAVTATPTPTKKPSPKPRTTLKKTTPAGADTGPAPASPPSDGVPATGAGTFTIGSGGTGIVGTGSTLVTYRVELEDGIAWGANPVWTADSFAAAADGVYADPRGWIASGAAPVTDAAQHMDQASWSFQRVSGPSFSVRILLATPGTTDRMCGQVGLKTEGVYSCRYGTTILINLRRWLNGAPGFPMDLSGYRTMVLDHEMGHLLGFKHMLCPAAGTPAPIMSTETIDLGGCTPNKYPFAADGTFIDGPFTSD